MGVIGVPFAGCLVLLLASILSGPAFAAKNVAGRSRIARKACLAGDYAKGVSLLSDLFVETQDYVFIFNQGRCFEQNMRYEEAIGRFQEFMRANPSLSQEQKESAEKHIADCQALLDKRSGKTTIAAASPPPPPPAPIETPPPIRPEPLPPPTPVQVEARSQTANPPSGSGLKIAGIVVAGVGVAALGSAVFLNLKTNQMTTDLEKRAGYSSSKASQRDTYVTLSWIGYAVGGAGLATGALLYYLGHRSAQDSTSSSSVAIVPSFGSGQVGAVLAGGF